MARHLVTLLLSDMDAGRYGCANLSHHLACTSAALWPNFYSARRVGQLEAYIQSSLLAYLDGCIDRRHISGRLTMLLEMSARRDSRLTHVISSDL